MPTHDRSARLNMRIAPDALAVIREAAAAQQQDVTSFVLGAAMNQARSVLLTERVMHLTPAEAAQVDAALSAEARTLPELAALIGDAQASDSKTRTEVPVGSSRTTTSRTTSDEP